jgi:predicted kinase
MLTIIRGVPGSGKSTLAEHLKFSLHSDGIPTSIFEADQYFETADGYKFDGTKLRDAHADCQARTRKWLARGSNAIVANTFTQRWEYQSYLDMAAELNVPVQVIEVHGDFGNTHGVPADKVASMRARWEPHR